MSFYSELAQSLSEVASKIKGIPQLTWTNLWKEEVQMVLLILFFLGLCACHSWRCSCRTDSLSWLWHHLHWND